MITYTYLTPAQCALLGWECGRTWVDAYGRPRTEEGTTSIDVRDGWEWWAAPPHDGTPRYYRQAEPCSFDEVLAEHQRTTGALFQPPRMRS